MGNLGSWLCNIGAKRGNVMKGWFLGRCWFCDTTILVLLLPVETLHVAWCCCHLSQNFKFQISNFEYILLVLSGGREKRVLLKREITKGNVSDLKEKKNTFNKKIYFFIDVFLFYLKKNIFLWEILFFKVRNVLWLWNQVLIIKL
jgi:hypothetical protein